MDQLQLRTATVEDVDSINEIYNHYVTTSTATAATIPMTREERIQWLTAHEGKYVAIVAETQGAVVGWGSLSRYHVRPAYAPTTENSVYIRQDLRGRGIGQRILAELISQARKQGFHSILAMIATEQNASNASLGLHEKAGFRRVGQIPAVIRKFDRWIDLSILQLRLETEC